MTYIDLIYKTDLHSGVPVVAEKSPFVFGDAQAHRITVMSTDGQRIEGSVTADFVNSAGDAATIVGDAENGKAVVVLPQWCYALPGAFALLVRVTDGTQTTTVLNLRGVVGQSYTSLGDVPDAVETTVAQLVARYDQKVAQQDKKIQQQDKQIEQLNEAIESKVKATQLEALKGDLDEQTALLKAVRDALKNGDIDGAIGLLDSFLLDKGALA